MYLGAVALLRCIIKLPTIPFKTKSGKRCAKPTFKPLRKHVDPANRRFNNRLVATGVLSLAREHITDDTVPIGASVHAKLMSMQRSSDA
jgi:hypothetical protein